ncbi:MAG: nitroreductase [Actinomadura sp.]
MTQAEHADGPGSFTRPGDAAVEGAEFLSVITARHCKRAFLDRPVPREVLERVLATAAHAPSPRNTQYWQVAVVQGEARTELSRRMCAAFDSTESHEPDYENRPTPMGELHEQRSFDWGAAFYGALGIGRDDHEARDEFVRKNLRFYGAPVAMIFHLPRNAVPGNFLEVGLYLQNVMLGLVACGLGSCPQYTVARYTRVIRDFLGLGPERLVVCSLSVGYVDESAPINKFHPDRANLDEYIRWHGH